MSNYHLLSAAPRNRWLAIFLTSLFTIACVPGIHPLQAHRTSIESDATEASNSDLSPDVAPLGGPHPSSNIDPAQSCSLATRPYKIIETGVVGAHFSKQAIAPSRPEEVLAFSLTTSKTEGGGVADLARTSSTRGSWLMVISECPGDLDTLDKDGGCVASAYDTISRTYLVGPSTLSLSSLRYCHLAPGRTYYVNIASVGQSKDDPGCTSKLECQFSIGIGGM